MKTLLRRVPGVRRAYIQMLKIYSASRQVPGLLEWNTSPKRWASYRRFRALHNKHRGQRCFIVGNGPSLNQTDLSLLQNEYTITTNRAYLMYERMGGPSSYYVSINVNVINQFAEDIAQLPMPKFLNWVTHKNANFTDSTIFIRTVQDFDFSFQPQHFLYEGSTVTYAAMQIAYYLGFQQVILIGVDHNFVTKGDPNKKVVSEGSDPNHFDPNYFGKGIVWQLPDLEGSERAYQRAKEVYEQDGREIVDATIDGKLQIYRKVAYSSLF